MNLTLAELQRRARTGDEQALADLGRAVLDMEFCTLVNPRTYCEHLIQLEEDTFEFENALPLDCPHCGRFYDYPVGGNGMSRHQRHRKLVRDLGFNHFGNLWIPGSRYQGNPVSKQTIKIFADGRREALFSTTEKIGAKKQ